MLVGIASQRSGAPRITFMLYPLQEVLREFRETSGLDLQMRIGIHVGSVVHGVVGSESPRFCECPWPGCAGMHCVVVHSSLLPPTRVQASSARPPQLPSARRRTHCLAPSHAALPLVQRTSHRRTCSSPMVQHLRLCQSRPLLWSPRLLLCPPRLCPDPTWSLQCGRCPDRSSTGRTSD